MKMNEAHTLSKYQVLTGSHLKLIAVITMFIDHAAFIFSGCTNVWHQPLLQTSFSFWFLLRQVGRLAFPIFCFLLTEGFAHTKNRKKYGLNLLIFALLSEIPFNLMRGGNLLNLRHQNVYFTLLFGYLLICLWESKLKNWQKVLIFVAALAVLPYFRADYGRDGALLILLLHVFREQKLLRGIFSLPLLSGGLAAWCAFIPINLYNGERGFISGKVMKYAFYAFYPLHILLLYGIRMLIP